MCANAPFGARAHNKWKNPYTTQDTSKQINKYKVSKIRPSSNSTIFTMGKTKVEHPGEETKSMLSSSIQCHHCAWIPWASLKKAFPTKMVLRVPKVLLERHLPSATTTGSPCDRNVVRGLCSFLYTKVARCSHDFHGKRTQAKIISLTAHSLRLICVLL